MKQAGKLEDQLKIAYIITGMWHNPNAVVELSVHEVAQMAFIVDTWVKAHWRDVKEAPSKETSSLSIGLNIYTPYELVALSNFIAEVFEKRIRT